MKAGKLTSVVPQLRFPEFRDAGEWDEKKLGNLFHLQDGFAFKSIDFVKYKEGATQVIRITDINKKNTNDDKIYIPNAYIEKNNLNRYSVDNGDLLLSLTGAAGFNFFLWDGGCAVINQRTAKVSAKKESNSGLMRLLEPLVHEKINARGEGQNNNLSKEFLSGVMLFVPSPTEQQKIADCLGWLDGLIAAQGRKLDTLRQHKQGLMQQLFPRPGETVPQLRFPEFRNEPGWQPTTIGKHVELLSGFPFAGADIVEDKSGTRLLRGINITEGVIRHNVEIDRYYCGSTMGLEKYVLKKGDLVIGMDGSKVGKNSSLITPSDAGALLVQRVARLRAKNYTTIRFIFYHVHSPKFHAYVDRINTSSGIPHISAKQINEFAFCLPRKTEQQKVADCLGWLDGLIAAQGRKLDTLRRHKQGLMQQLFPSQEAIES